ncbi:MAG TPA: HPr family phosphocarrier protein, partial [Terriglobales bacterium]|nr:HPr family phosphocarrier protein [Terriglobales bacterium]
MPVEFTYRCTLPSGLHARPCSHIAAIAGRFRAEASLTNQRTGRTANLKSVLSLISASVLEGDDCSLVFAGDDDAAAADAVRTFVEKEMAALEEPVQRAPVGQRTLPRMLRVSGIEAAFGMPLSPGFGRGKLRVAGGICLPELGSGERAGDLHGEQRRLQRAMTELRNKFQETARESSGVAAAIV